jgi:hypothetical protein
LRRRRADINQLRALAARISAGVRPRDRRTRRRRPHGDD